MPAGRKPREYTERQLRRLRASWNKEPMMELAAELGISKDTLWRLGKRLGLPVRPRHPRAKIAEYYSRNGFSLEEVGQHFGCSKSVVHGACREAGIPMRPRGYPSRKESGKKRRGRGKPNLMGSRGGSGGRNAP